MNAKARETAHPTSKSNGNLELRVMEKILTIPDEYRWFRVRLPQVAKYGLQGELLEGLLDGGLPHAGRGSDILFDILDLQNIALNLRTYPYWHAVRLLGKSLNNAKWIDSDICEIKLDWSCPKPGHQGDCFFSPTQEAVRLFGDDGWDAANAGGKRIEVHLLDADYYFGDSLLPLVDEARRMEFHKLPDQLAEDLGFLAETGLADCRLATCRLLQVAAEAGLTARPACGFFISVFPDYHVWPEIQANDDWKAADPFFLNTLREWEVVDPESWPLLRSPRRVLWRMAARSSYLPFIMHNERRAKVSLSLRRLPKASFASTEKDGGRADS